MDIHFKNRFVALQRVGSVAVATLMLAGTSVAITNVAGAATRASSAVASSKAPTNGVWPGVGKICEPGAGGASSVRGVGSKTINIAVFNDAANTIDPGLGEEFPEQATAFADWCNASGGINGRHIVIDNQDGALFNAAQVTEQACQSDFMAVGGGLVLDQSAVPVREKCGLGQITGYVVSDASKRASDQVDPNGNNPSSGSSGWFGSLAKAYPQAVKKAGMGGSNSPSVLEVEHGYEYDAQAQGWKVIDFQEPPLSVDDWTPYIEEAQSKGVEALWPSDSSGTIAPYFQAMNTAGYHPSFIMLGENFYNPSTTQAVAANPGLPPVYVETEWWPLEMAAQNPSTEQMIRTMHTYAKGDTIDYNDESSAGAWLLWAKSASACGANLTVSCVLDKAAATKNWSGGGMQAVEARLATSAHNPQPSPCFVILKAEPKGFVYDKAITGPTQGIWNCKPSNVIHYTAQQQASL